MRAGGQRGDHTNFDSVNKSNNFKRHTCCLKFLISPGSLFFSHQIAIGIVEICSTLFFLNEF